MGSASHNLPGLDRRESYRARYFGAVEYEWSAARHTARTLDLSVSGMLIETPAPLSAGAEFVVRLALPEGAPVEAVCVVRRVVAGVGMGVEFADLKPADLTRVRQLVESLPH
jgi:hypothetical protein